MTIKDEKYTGETTDDPSIEERRAHGHDRYPRRSGGSTVASTVERSTPGGADGVGANGAPGKRPSH